MLRPLRIKGNLLRLHRALAPCVHSNVQQSFAQGPRMENEQGNAAIEPSTLAKWHSNKAVFHGELLVQGQLQAGAEAAHA